MFKSKLMKICLTIVCLLLIINMIGCRAEENDVLGNVQNTIDTSQITQSGGQASEQVDSSENHDNVDELFQDFYEMISNQPILSVVIVKDDTIVSQYYKDGYDEDSIFTLNSCTKSITSALVGIAIDRGYIEGVDVKISDYFPQLNHSEDERKKEITLEHLMNMTMGNDWPEWTTWNYGFGNGNCYLA